MHPIERMLTDALAEGREPALSELGGARAFADARMDLAGSDWVHELLGVAVTAWLEAGSDDRRDLEAFIIACASAPIDGILARDAVLVVCRGALPRDLLKICFDAYLARSADRTAEPAARWWSLYGAWHLTGDEASRKYRLLAALEEIPLDDDPSFLRHVAKIAGAAYARWREPPMLDRLRRLADIESARDEAAFELGMATLATAIEATETDEAEERFGHAEAWFAVSRSAREDRPDAEAYWAAVRAVLAFRRGEPPTVLDTLAGALQRAAVLHLAWHADEDDPPLLSLRLTEAFCWQSLAMRLGRLAESLDQPSWLHAEAVLESEVFAAYVAGRSFLGLTGAGGLEALVRPRIEDTFLLRRHQTALLDQWLAEKGPTTDWAEVASDLRQRLHSRETLDRLGNRSGTPPTTSLAASR